MCKEWSQRFFEFGTEMSDWADHCKDKKIECMLAKGRGKTIIHSMHDLSRERLQNGFKPHIGMPGLDAPLRDEGTHHGCENLAGVLCECGLSRCPCERCAVSLLRVWSSFCSSSLGSSARETQCSDAV